MSLSSPRRRSWLAAGALAVVAGALVWAGPVGAATTLDVVSVVPGDAAVTTFESVKLLGPPPRQPLIVTTLASSALMRVSDLMVVSCA